MFTTDTHTTPVILPTFCPECGDIHRIITTRKVGK